MQVTKKIIFIFKVPIFCTPKKEIFPANCLGMLYFA